MTQNDQNSKDRRTNISLTGEYVALLEKNRAAIEKRLGITVTLAFVIKLALREQASLENVE